MTNTPPTILFSVVTNPMTGVTAPPPAIAVIISPEISFAFSGRACIAIE